MLLNKAIKQASVRLKVIGLNPDDVGGTNFKKENKHKPNVINVTIISSLSE